MIKLILAYFFVATVISVVCVGAVMADGLDDPNFYKDFDRNPWAEKYKSVRPPLRAIKPPVIEYAPECFNIPANKPPAQVPEPAIIGLLLTAFGIKKLWKK